MSYKNNTSKVDLLLIPPIKVLKGDELNKYEGKSFYQYLIDNVSSIQKNEKIAKNLYFHYLRNNEVLKSSVLAIDKIMSDGVIIQTWKPGHNKKQKTSMIASPIIIAKQWFIIVIVQIQNLKKQIFPYAIRLFSKKQIQEMTENKPVHDNTEIMSQEGNKNVFVSNSSPESVAKVLQKYLISNRIIANKSKNNNSQELSNKDDTIYIKTKIENSVNE